MAIFFIYWYLWLLLVLVLILKKKKTFYEILIVFLRKKTSGDCCKLRNVDFSSKLQLSLDTQPRRRRTCLHAQISVPFSILFSCINNFARDLSPERLAFYSGNSIKARIYVNFRRRSPSAPLAQRPRTYEIGARGRDCPVSVNLNVDLFALY